MIPHLFGILAIIWFIVIAVAFSIRAVRVFRATQRGEKRP